MDLLHTDSKFVLDISTICLFFELSKELGLNYSHKFIISAFVKSDLLQLIEETKSIPEKNLTLNITTKGISKHEAEPGASKRKLDFLIELKNWIESNCVIDNVEEKLNMVTAMPEELRNDGHTKYTMDNRMIIDRPNYFLLTNDVCYYRFLHASTDSAISPQIYLKKYFPNNALEIAKNMLRKNYIGIELNAEILQEEFSNMVAQKENKFVICVENLGYSWNPVKQHINEVVAFLKWLYLNAALINIRMQVANTVLISILNSRNSEVNKEIKRLLIYNFKLLGVHYDEIMRIYNEVISMFKK